ncbi:tannase/feruloyl esterase family alpha/beta hydrolase [Cupriavidus sp. AU9028]|uniref:tannase/feruloyl esterase family alpha/beta hydrolase n=1 Tax=Cupriavidus sp. AU9028 TaxID=2871157 RepID=UPI001C95706B|nr:tannase/feruloyl esterase family alpha/beta hydrolase [Cupriavidus sp. AU9028]MBY4896622.1 tannase/feruloyl esterase family alpha/beta hydrolase [Cupriavidus sp. AU9028]
MHRDLLQSRRRRLALTLTPVAAALLLAGCGGDDDDDGAHAPPPEPPPTAQQPLDCGQMARAVLDGATVTAAAEVPAGSFAPASGTTLQVESFCRVQAVARPTSDSEIRFEVWIPPAPRWNGKLMVAGNGGYSPALGYRAMAMGLARGYATVSGDTGHQTSNPNDLLFGVGHPEKIVDWGTRSIHAITVPAKRLVSEMHARPIDRSYFYGCSTGGHQGYAEAQRYPDDFDGIIAGAPGNNRVRLNAGFLWQFLANHRRNDNTTPIIPASKLPMVTQAAVAACDADDGVTDGLVDDPRQCRFAPASLQCTGADAPDCLTAEQVSALEAMYAGPRNPRTGEQVYPGWPKTSEALFTVGTNPVGWNTYWGTTEPTRADFWRYWVFDNPQWNWWTFDFDRDLAYADARVGTLVDQNSTDLSAFKASGGKLLVYNGWQDPVVNAVDTIGYFERVRQAQGSQGEMDAFFRLYLVPGMGHCSGGPGPTQFGNGDTAAPVVDAGHDILEALDAWVTQGRAPDRIVASTVTDDVVTRTRPLCPYPRRAVYVGSGSTDEAANFQCR